MPELPEVLRATRRLLRYTLSERLHSSALTTRRHSLAKGMRISRVLANEDTIVYMGTTASEFVSRSCLKRRTGDGDVTGAEFWYKHKCRLLAYRERLC